MTAFFERFDDNGFVATELCRGPWHRDFAHGPPAAILGRALERAAAELDRPFHIARVQVEIPRPVPLASLTIQSRIEKAGRQVSKVSALLTHGGKICCAATALCIRREAVDLPSVSTPDAAGPIPPGDGRAFTFPFATAERGYQSAMEISFARGKLGDGDVAAWMRMRYPLIAGEEPSPLQRVLIAADSGNGLSMAVNPREITFLNPDLNVALFRLPQGEWIGMESRTDLRGNGIGLADTRLWDESGPIGRSNQTLVVGLAN